MTDKKKGRPAAPYTPEFVRDISVQLHIASYNSKPSAIRANLQRDPKWPNKLREQAFHLDTRVRVYLAACGGGAYLTDEAEILEAKYLAHISAFEPPMTPEQMTAKGMETKHRRYATDGFSGARFDEVRDAHKRVIDGNLMELEIPDGYELPPPQSNEAILAQDDDDFF